MESSEHVSLVKFIEEIICKNYDVDRLFSFSDTVDRIGKKSPPAIEGFVPDVVYQDISGNHIIIGEAKTKNDIKSSHTRLQLTAFLFQLYYQGTGVLIVSVSHGCENEMRSLLRYLCQENNLDGIDYQVISHLSVREAN